MINKELLTAVLGSGIYYHISVENGVISWNNGDPHEEINIYEFTNKCKVWAYNNGYYLPTIYCGEVVHCGIGKIDRGYIWAQKSCFIENSEPEAIFKACLYILSSNAAGFII